MDAFLENPSEAAAQQLLETTSLPQLLSVCPSQDSALDFLKFLFQLNKFNIISVTGLPDLCTLLSNAKFQKPILENLQCIEFPPQDYSSFISVLFSIFSSEDIGASKLSQQILVQKFGSVLSTPAYMSTFSQLLSQEDTVLKVRALELVIELANSYNFEIFEQNGLIDCGISMITCGDILLQIVAVEVIVDLGNSEAGCRKLISAGVQRVLVDAYDNSSEPHFRNRVILIIGKIAHFTGNFNLVNEKYWKNIEKMIQEPNPATCKNALASLGFLSCRSQGLSLVLGRKNLLAELRNLQKSSNQSIKGSFYSFFSGFLQILSEEQLSSVVSVTQPFSAMVNELVNPFQESHSDILKCLIEVVKYKDQSMNLLGVEKFKEYIFKRPPHQVHEVSYLKFEIVKGLNAHDLPQSVKTKCELYLKSGVFAGPGEEDVELESMN